MTVRSNERTRTDIHRPDRQLKNTGITNLSQLCVLLIYLYQEYSNISKSLKNYSQTIFRLFILKIKNEDTFVPSTKPAVCSWKDQFQCFLGKYKLRLSENDTKHINMSTFCGQNAQLLKLEKMVSIGITYRELSNTYYSAPHSPWDQTQTKILLDSGNDFVQN
jgi:hypothetical protein